MNRKKHKIRKTCTYRPRRSIAPLTVYSSGMDELSKAFTKAFIEQSTLDMAHFISQAAAAAPKNKENIC